MIALMALVLGVSDAVKSSLIVLIGGPLCALAVGWQLNRQNRASKAEEYRRQDEVANTAKEVAEDAAREAAAVASTAREAAALLLEAQTTTRSDADEVARVAADRTDGPNRSRLLAVVISHPSGYRREVKLDAVPSTGEHILLRNMPADSQPSQVVDVLWVEANGEPRPSVVIVVKPVEPDPGRGLMEAAAEAAP